MTREIFEFTQKDVDRKTQFLKHISYFNKENILLLATNIIHLHDYYTIADDSYSLDEVTFAIEKHFETFNLHTAGTNFRHAEDSVLAVKLGFEVEPTLDVCSALNIISAASKYENFMEDSCNFKFVQVQT